MVVYLCWPKGKRHAFSVCKWTYAYCIHRVHMPQALLWHKFGVTDSHMEIVWPKVQICTSNIIRIIIRNKQNPPSSLYVFASLLVFPSLVSSPFSTSPAFPSLWLCQMLQCGCRCKDFSQILVWHTRVDTCTQLQFYEEREPISALTIFWKLWTREWKREKKEGFGSDEGWSEEEGWEVGPVRKENSILPDFGLLMVYLHRK